MISSALLRSSTWIPFCQKKRTRVRLPLSPRRVRLLRTCIIFTQFWSTGELSGLDIISHLSGDLCTQIGTNSMIQQSLLSLNQRHSRSELAASTLTSR
jgi:hypothetical protein